MASKNKIIKVEETMITEEYIESDQYKALVEDCNSTRTEMIYAWRIDFIIMHGVIGQRIFTDPLYGKFKKGNFLFIGRLARDIKMSHQELYESIEFYKRYGIVSEKSEGWDRFKEGKNISWNKIVTLYLRGPKEECKCSKFETIQRCVKCKKIKK